MSAPASPPNRSTRLLFTLLAALALVAAAGCGTDADDRAAPPAGDQGSASPAQLDLLVALDRPTSVAARPGSDDLYVTLQADGVAVLAPLDDGTYEQQSELLIDRTSENFDAETFVEAGILGLTFSADGSKLYLVESLPTFNPDNEREVEWRLLEYTLDGNTVIEGSERVLLAVTKERPVHNSGQVRFGPDGFLYFGLGDGWPFGDDLETGQDPSDHLGTVMRIDPTPGPDGRPYTIPADNPFADGVDGAPEVWIYGVRNPWRFDWDADTGDLWLTDVGDSEIEEINRIPAGDDRGANLGWSEVEGSRAYEGGTAPPNAIPPLYEYEHAPGRCAVIGGALMPPDVVPGYDGWFVYSDFCALEIFAIDPDANPPEQVGLATTELSVTSVESSPDADGEGDRLLVTTLDGLYQLAAAGD